MNELELRFTVDEEREAERFAAALDALEAELDPGVDPAEDPSLYALLQSTAQLTEGVRGVEPRGPYRARSRALVIDAGAPLAGRSARRRPLFSSTGFLVPFSAAAAAAGLTIAAVLGASAFGYGPGGGKAAVRNSEQREPVRTAANLTQLSIKADLQNLQSSLDAVVAAAGRGEDLDPRLLRSITESSLMVTSLIENSPEQVRVEEVISYYQTAAETRIKLSEIQPMVSSTPALAAAQQASEGGVVAAARHLQAVQERLARGHGTP